MELEAGVALKQGKRTVYVVSGARTPLLKAQGVGEFSASDLAVQAGKQLFSRLPITATDLNQVIVGCVMPSPKEANIARVIGLRLGMRHAMPAWTVQRNCASGLQAIDSAYHAIATGSDDLVLAGGTEAMSHAPVMYPPAMAQWLADWVGARGGFAKIKQLAKLKPRMFAPKIALIRNDRSHRWFVDGADC